MRDLFAYNSALLGKWLVGIFGRTTELVGEGHRFQVCVFSVEHFSWMPQIRSDPYGVGNWRPINRGWSTLVGPHELTENPMELVFSNILANDGLISSI